MTHAHDWQPAPWLRQERTDGTVALMEACACGANRYADRRPMWLQRQDENGARDLTGQVTR